MAGVLLLPNIASHSWLDDLMPKTPHSDNSCCENATETSEGRDRLGRWQKTVKKKSVYL